jgi:hypothetical protein
MTRRYIFAEGDVCIFVEGGMYVVIAGNDESAHVDAKLALRSVVFRTAGLGEEGTKRLDRAIKRELAQHEEKAA